jgi:hypothetical protein
MPRHAAPSSARSRAPDRRFEASLASAKGDGKQRTKIAQKSVAARVLSRETSMLVLESESDYPRYGLDRQGLGDVLVVGARGVERASPDICHPHARRRWRRRYGHCRLRAAEPPNDHGVRQIRH